VKKTISNIPAGNEILTTLSISDHIIAWATEKTEFCFNAFAAASKIHSPSKI
jgi:hypothetical protein